MNLITQAEFARQQGFSKPYVCKLVKQGIVVLEDGKVNREQAELALAAQRNPDLPLRRSGMSSSDAGDLNRQYLEAKVEREHENIKLLRAKANAEVGKLVDVESVKKEAFTMARKVRDGLLNLPDRLAAMFASNSDEKEIHNLLTKEINFVLEELSK